MSVLPDEFRKHPEISVLRESLCLFQSGAAGCRSSNSAELAEAAILPSGAQSPALPGTAQHQLSSESCPTSLCPHRAPSCAGSVGIITTYVSKELSYFSFPHCTSASRSPPLSQLFCLSLSLLSLATVLISALMEGDSFAFEGIPRLLLG